LTDTAYFSQAEKFGIRILAPVAGKDFVFGIGTDWENTIGLSRAQIGPPAAGSCATYHAAVFALPCVAADRMAGAGGVGTDLRRQVLQPAGPASHFHSARTKRLPYRIAWNPAAHVEQKQDKVVVTSRRGSLGT
jgi:hypothetical protein